METVPKVVGIEFDVQSVNMIAFESNEWLSFKTYRMSENHNDMSISSSDVSG